MAVTEAGFSRFLSKGTMKKKSQTVRIQLLGGFRVSVGSRTVGEDGWRLKKAKSLLKLLALAPGHRMHREHALDLLWPDSGSESQVNNLRQALHAARRALKPAPGASSNNYLQLLGDQVALCPEGDVWVDVRAFEEAATTARRVGEPPAYRAAIDLYAGELLPEDRYEGWAEERRDGLRGTYISLLLELAVLYEEGEEFEEAIGALRKAVVEEPTREEAHMGLMRLYSLTGRRQEALLQYERLRKALLEELGAEEPGEAGRLLYEEIRAGLSPVIQPPAEEDRTRAEPSDSPRHNLPVERTSFVGRQEEMVEVERLLAMTGLLTLTGTGGSGKTRFALALARKLAGAYSDGAWLVELAPLSDPELVKETVAVALGVREQPGHPLTATLKEHLSSKKLLLVMDNCEHLVEAAARLVQTLLDSCQNLKVLATSREALNVSGELIWPVPSLSVPDNGSGDYYSPTTVEELGRYESVRLFVERAQYRRPSFELTPENARAVAEVCGRLEGIPLAIELAAARVGVLEVGQISRRLKDSLGVLAGGNRTAEPRQRTLRGALEWSYDLLGELERKLFCRLSVFAGDWILEAAEAVCAGGELERSEVLDLLSQLVDKSLVLVEERDGEARYRLLETVRQYGREKLEESGEEDEVRRRHALYFLQLAEEAESELKGHQQVVWLERLETEHDNLRAAMRFLLNTGETEAAARLIWALWFFWRAHGHQGEGYRYAGEVLEKGDALPTDAKAKVLNARGIMSYGLESIEGTERLWEQSVALFRQTEDKSGLALALGGMGIMALARGDFDRSTALFEEGLKLYRELGDKWGVGSVLSHLGIIPLSRGEYERAMGYFEEALALSREIGDRLICSISLHNLAWVSRLRGDHERAAGLYVEGLGVAVELGDKAGVAYCLEGLAGLIATEDRPQRKARLFGASEAVLETVGAPLYVQIQDRALYQRTVEELRSRLGEEAFEAAWSEGRAMTPEQAIKYALSEEEPSTKATMSEELPAGDERPVALTPREREVAMLVARELTNRRIAEELVISERTVATHVHKILEKLNFRSRLQIAAWAMEQDLLR
jgi:predicted ATPase/DNA-binding SARP family transcriptional activator/DNA-binding CsgD family transcriptional regulator